MPNHSALGTAIQSAAASAPDIRSQIKAALGALWAYILANGRSFIDTPEERAVLEAEAIKAFNFVFADKLGPTAEMFLDGLVTTAIDRELAWLAATPNGG